MEVSSKISINNDKSLCLYCDKTFSSKIDRENHVERDHKTILYKGKGSRKSERITKNNSISENSPFPGCFHCNKKIFKTDNLDFLFQHLLTSHKDVYFGCKCRIRTHDKVSLASHKKDCKIGGKSKLLRRLKGKSDDKHKTSKKLHSLKFNDERKFHTLSDKEEIFSTAVSNHSKTLPVNAILQKFDKNKLKKHSKMVCVNDKGNKIKNSDSSSRASSISIVKVAEEEYTIPLTRQKLKETPILSRVNTSHSRSSSVKKPVKLKQNTSSESKITTNPSPSNRIQRTKTTKFINLILHNNFETVENAQKNETVNVEFDEDFYKNISNNIRLNLNYFVDGKSDQLLNRPVFDQISEQSITSSAKYSTVHDKEIYEATNFKLSTPFPALLTAEQYGFGDSNPNKNKRQVTKNSWKWKWDLIKKYKYVNEGGKIVKKVKQITTGLKDLSQLDMWTQLSMRSRYENLNNQNDSSSVFDNGLKDRLSTRMIKTQNIEQLNRILDNRLTPEINIEQLEQTIIKIEAEEFEQTAESVDINVVRNESNEQKTELLKTFNLVKNDTSVSSIPTLSGEWARPRCYICIDCGLKFDLMKSLNDHKNSEHPYVVSAHYEIVGRENLELKLYKNLFLPKKAFRASGFARSLSVNSDSKSNETNEASASSDFSSKYFADQKEKVCSKCLKTIKYSSDIDINRHILDCIEDRAWLQAKRRSKYRKSRRKNRKSTKKSKTSFDQKKSTSSPSTKDNTEGENSTHSISNPPTPKNDVKPTAHISNIVNKGEFVICENKSMNGRYSEGMNIKKFFRVSKTTPSAPQKIDVKMLEIPHGTKNASLKNSLRSPSKISKKSQCISKNDSVSKNDKRNITEVSNSEENNYEIVKKVQSDNLVEKNASNEEVKILPHIPLTLGTLEKCSGDFSLSSTSSSSLISPTSNPIVPKKKKKLNDCIAMLTCKIQEKLGVNFFETSISTEAPPSDQLSCVSPCSSLKAIDLKLVDNNSQLASLLKSPVFDIPVQDEVIDLSLKKRKATIENTTKEINKIFKETNSTESKIIPEISPGMNPSAVRSVNDELKVPNERESKVEIAKSINEYDSKTEEDKKDGIENQIMKEIVFNKSYSENNLIEKSKEEASKNISENLKENNSLVLEPLLEEQSFKISIPKVKIPNLKEILDQHQVITVNKIKISEQERRAFEEQKNRILQILNKAHNATKTVSGRKVLHKKYSKKAVKRKPSRRKISLRKPTVKNYGPVKQNSEVQSGMSKSSPVVDLDNIADVIKTTNRIRCRRLSVVVDPIINLSTLKNTNRKIRLTNNSQQNGFYELLSSSEQVFGKDESNNARKSNTLLCYGSSGTNVKSEIFLSSENEKTDINALKVPSRTRGNKSRTINSTNNHVIAAITNKNEVDDNPSIEEIVKNETIKPIVCNSEPNVNEKISSLKFIKPSVSTRKSRMRNQNVKKVSLATTDITSDENQIKEHANQYLSTNESKKISKIQEKKSPTKNNKTKNTPLEEIKDEQRVKHVNTKLQLEKRKKLTREKQQLKTEKILDISFSSDTSNENDMPLSKLISPMENEVSTVIEIFSDSVKIDSMVEKESVEFQQLSTIGKTEGILRNDQQIEEPKMSINVSSDSFKIALTVKQSDLDYSTGKKCLKNNKKASKKIKEKLSTNKINHVEEEQKNQKKSISLPVVAPLTECKIKKENDNFTINEDSFFNDDLDNDHSDKINDIVNNIINSSEFQIDSETEKSFHENEIANNQILPSCTICKRTFRNETVLKKHCKTSTHIMKVQRKYRGMSRLKEKTIEKSDVYENAEVSESHSPSLDDAKVFRTKGALKTFDNILDTPVKEEEEQEIKINNQESSIVEKPVIKPKQATVESMLDANDDKLYYEFKMEKKPEDMTPKDRDKLFDSLFNTLEVNAFENCKPYTPKSNFSTATFLDSEIESSSTSWDLKHDPDIEWEGDNIDNVPFANAIKERYPKKFPIRINKSKDTAVSIPTKSLIMDKIFKKHRDRSKLKIPQADAPKNMPGIKNSLDEIFDHLKNSAEIDDKVLTCPSPKTLLKSASETFSPNSSNSNNMLETASQSYNNNYYPGKLFNCNLKKEGKKTKVKDGIESDLFHDSVAEDFDSTIGKRKSRRRCAIKTKTFAETWSSDEYEELHDTADIISIINEIEKRESIKKRKLSKTEEHYKKFEDNLIDESLFKNDIKCSSSKIYEAHVDKKPLQSGHQISLREKIEKKKTAQIELSNETNQSDRSFPIKKKIGIKEAEGHKSDEETFTATKNVKPIKAGVSIKKRRMSCFVPSTTSFDDRTRSKLIVKPTKETLRKINLETLRSFPLENKTFEIKSKSMISKAESEKSYKNQKKFVNLSNNFSSHKKKIHKHRKRPRNRIKNIAYDSDSDFELNLNTKSKTSTLNESSLSENEKDEENDHKTVSFKTKKSMMTLSKSCNTCDMTTLKELKLIPNDLKHVDVSSTTFASAITHDILDPSQSACNRTKRNSSEKLYYWSSSSSESDQEQGDTADGDNEDSALPQQPEQHGWIVGDSHKKLVTLLAHAKIKNKLN